MLEGKSVFFTGNAGTGGLPAAQLPLAWADAGSAGQLSPTCCACAACNAGKSFLLNRIISVLTERYGKHSGQLAVTAATGIAATHIGGTTLHSFAGCGIPMRVQDFGRMWSDIPKKRWRALVSTLAPQVGPLPRAQQGRETYMFC